MPLESHGNMQNICKRPEQVQKCSCMSAGSQPAAWLSQPWCLIQGASQLVSPALPAFWMTHGVRPTAKALLLHRKSQASVYMPAQQRAKEVHLELAWWKVDLKSQMTTCSCRRLNISASMHSYACTTQPLISGTTWAGCCSHALTPEC